MTVSQRITSQQLVGSLAPWVGIDRAFATVSGSLRMTGLDLRVTDPPSGGSVVAMVNTAPGGGGSALLQGTISDGSEHVHVDGDIAVADGTTLYLRVVSESGAAFGLSASVELSLPSGATVTALLATLDQVKASAEITGSSSDAVIQTELEGVSRAMQEWMGRPIVQGTIVGERHFEAGLETALLLGEWPVVSIDEVRLDGDVMDPSSYRAEPNRLLRRVSNGRRRTWEKHREIEVDYTAGFASVPPSLVAACVNETARRFLQSAAGNGPGPHVIADTPETGDTKTFATDGFLETTIEAMKPFRRLF